MSDQGQRPLPSKLYFRIGEVAELVGVEPHVLRYWEREFRSIRPTKSAKGQRVYSRKDVESLQRVRELLYADGFTIAGAKKKMSRNAADTSDAAAEKAPALEAAPAAAVEISARSVASKPIASAPATSRVRTTLLALRGEVESFLEELGSP